MDASDGTNSSVLRTCGERGTIITNGNQGATGGETVNVCTDEDLLNGGRAQTYEFQREYSDNWHFATYLCGTPSVFRWHCRVGKSLSADRYFRDGYLIGNDAGRYCYAPFEKIHNPCGQGRMGRADQEMVIAAHRSIQTNRQPIQLPLEPDPAEEEAFDRDFEAQFGVHPREDIEKALQVNFKAR